MSQIRPEYQLRVNRYKFNPVTQKEEPYLNKSSAIGRLMASVATVLLLLCTLFVIRPLSHEMYFFICHLIFSILFYGHTHQLTILSSNHPFY